MNFRGHSSVSDTLKWLGTWREGLFWPHSKARAARVSYLFVWNLPSPADSLVHVLVLEKGPTVQSYFLVR